MGKVAVLCVCCMLLVGSVGAFAAELLFPQQRTAFFSEEVIELAVAGLADGETATVACTAARPGVPPVSFPVTGDGSTMLVAFAPYSFGPGSYAVTLNEKPAGTLTIASGVYQSTMFTSQTAKGWANFSVSNAFSFGLHDRDGLPLADLRGKKSPVMQQYERAIATNTPALCYMYWTGYVTHKPFGSEKSWANAEMMATMRQLNFSVAQRLRRYGKAVLLIGSLDEPGLSWGPTPAGGMASGFPNWDEQPWYEARGWKYTQDIASQSDADWLKYISTRCNILGANFRQASADIKAAWPQATYSTDAYALHAIMDGTDALNQLANDVPSSHYFFDFLGGPLGTPAGMCLEKAACPHAQLAHAMNGQLAGVRGPQRPLYHQLMNGMLQGGIYSNWWLNTGGMTEADLGAVNKPAAMVGPLFKAMSLAGHDTAVLWSFSEIAMRQKEMAKLESTKTAGKQITLMLPLPDDKEAKEFSVASNAYEIGSGYATPVLLTHQALMRAGFPALIVDERLVANGWLKHVKTLVISGQTFPLPANVLAGMAAFQKAGGRVLLDKSSTVKIPGAIVFDADFSADALRLQGYRNQQLAAKAPNKREASRYETVDARFYTQARKAVAPLKAALTQAGVKPAVATASEELSIARHTAGEGMLIQVLNGREVLPDLPEDKPYPGYNPGPYDGATYTLQGVNKRSAVYGIEGLEWTTTSKLADPTAPITTQFAPGEMKLYLVAPRAPKGLKSRAKVADGQLQLNVTLDGVAMPWPVHVTVTAPDGTALHDIYRACDAKGSYTEVFPLGANAAAGTYTATMQALAGGFTSTATVKVVPKAITPALLAESARVFDAPAIRSFLATKPAVTIALGHTDYRPAADRLATALKAKGITATVAAEADVIRKAAYPRVWNPTATVYTAGGEAKPPAGEVKQTITARTAADGTVTYTDAAGKALQDYRQPQALVIVGDGGLLDWSGERETVYEAGVHLYLNDKRQVQVLNATAKQEKTTAEFKQRWAKPWSRLIGHVGGFQLPPSLPEAYATDAHVIVLGDSTTSQGMRILQASEILPQVVDAKYPGPGKALVQFAWSPFAVEKNAIAIGASDAAGVDAGITALLALLK